MSIVLSLCISIPCHHGQSGHEVTRQGQKWLEEEVDLYSKNGYFYPLAFQIFLNWGHHVMSSHTAYKYLPTHHEQWYIHMPLPQISLSPALSVIFLPNSDHPAKLLTRANELLSTSVSDHFSWQNEQPSTMPNILLSGRTSLHYCPSGCPRIEIQYYNLPPSGGAWISYRTIQKRIVFLLQSSLHRDVSIRSLVWASIWRQCSNSGDQGHPGHFFMQLTFAFRLCSSLILYTLLPVGNGLLFSSVSQSCLIHCNPMECMFDKFKFIASMVRQYQIHDCYIRAKSPYVSLWSLCSRAHWAWRRVEKGWLAPTEWVILYIWLVQSAAEVTILWAFTGVPHVAWVT